MNTAENAKDKLEIGARNVKDTVADAAGNAKDKLGKSARNVKDTVTDAAGNAKDKLETGAHNVKETVTDAAGTAKNKLEKGAENIKDGIGTSKSNLLKETYREYIQITMYSMSDIGLEKTIGFSFLLLILN